MERSDKIKAMEAVGIDEDTYNELLRSFVPEVEAEIGKLGEAVEKDDFAGIAAIGHGLKGMAGNLYITPMQDAAKAIEALAREGRDKQAIMGKIAALKQSAEELKQII